jgi:hypothetical protein
VFPITNFKKVIYPKLDDKSTYYFIINTDDYAGKHWVAFIKYKGENFMYDSFAEDINQYNPSFKALKFKQDRKDVEQSYVENSCGQNCLASIMIFKKYGPKKFMML